MKNRSIRITFPIMILIEVFATWFVGNYFNYTIGIFVGIVSVFHVIIMWAIGQILKNKQNENERLD